MGHVLDRIRRLEGEMGKPLEQILGEKLAQGMTKSEFAQQFLGLTLMQMAAALSRRAKPTIGREKLYPGKLSDLARTAYGVELDDLLRRWHGEGLLPPEMQERLPESSERQIQRHLKRLNLANTRSEARRKSIATGRTDYTVIQREVRKSLTKAMIAGSWSGTAPRRRRCAKSSGWSSESPTQCGETSRHRSPRRSGRLSSVWMAWIDHECSQTQI